MGKNGLESSKKFFKGGLSGCTFSFSKKGNIIKCSPSEIYNSRLYSQSEKQNKFYNQFQNDLIATPKIFSSGLNTENLFFFEMEYINEKDFQNFLILSSPSDLSFFCNSVSGYFLSLPRSEFYSPEDLKNSIKNKILDLKKYGFELEFLDFLDKRSDDIKTSIPKGFCHGDLTMANILLGKSKIYFLDFLDSFIESWIIDLIKIKQDFFYFWFLKKDGEKLSLREIQSSIFIWDSISKDFLSEIETLEFKILESLNFLRIYPYTKTEFQKKILLEILKKLPLYEEFNHTDGRKII